MPTGSPETKNKTGCSCEECSGYNASHTAAALFGLASRAAAIIKCEGVHVAAADVAGGSRVPSKTDSNGARARTNRCPRELGDLAFQHMRLA